MPQSAVEKTGTEAVGRNEKIKNIDLYDRGCAAGFTAALCIC